MPSLAPLFGVRHTEVHPFGNSKMQISLYRVNTLLGVGKKKSFVFLSVLCGCSEPQAGTTRMLISTA